MSTSLFMTARADDEASDDGNPSGVRTSVANTGGIFRADTGANTLRGKGPVKTDPRKFKYDVVRGKGAAVAFSVTRDDRMSAEDAGEMLHTIHEMFGLANEVEGILQAFDSGLWFCHTVNGGSVLNPGRAKFMVPGKTQVFDYAEIRNKLGIDIRRFFRAFADDITEVNRRVIRDYDPYDPVKAEHWGWLMEVAHDRGLSRYPYLAHDSADACTNLSLVERQALRASKALVIGGTPNSADQMVPTSDVTSKDKFDSSTGARY